MTPSSSGCHLDFVTRVDQTEASSCLRTFQDANKTRLRDELVGVWVTDGGSEFHGQCICGRRPTALDGL